MNVVGALRIRNEERWIERSIRSFLPICEHVYVLDDHSGDSTVDICRSVPEVTVFESPFTGLDEARDKSYLLDRATVEFPCPVDWVCFWDGDEALAPGAADVLTAAMRHAPRSVRALALPIWYLWDREDQRRADGVYRDMTRVSVFRPGTERFEATGAGNLHCGNCPQGIRGRQRVEAPLLHMGYLDRADRERKLAWYREQDPNNEREDNYSHICVGDIYPADSKFRHGGPLELRQL
jgi:glycosyltransferase involved in cell wall biosynthesis